VVWLRRTHPEIPRGYRVPLYPIVPLLGIVSCFALIFTVESRVLKFFGWYLVGAIILYFIYGMHNSKLGKGVHVPETGEPAYFPEDEPRDETGRPIIRP
jgi:APA family basic amino acid/polyamine antiporter